MSKPPVLRVAIAVPLRALFDYLPPENIAPDQLLPGVRLRVPFGKGERIAVLVEIVAESQVDPGLLKPAKEVLDRQPLLRSIDMDFLRWVAAYYQHPSGEVILSALPTRLRKGEAPVSRVEAAWQITALGRQAEPDSLKRSPRQLELLEFFQQQKEPVRRKDLIDKDSFSQSAMKALLEKGMVEVIELPLEPVAQKATSAAPELNSQQSNAVDKVLQQPGFAVSLLYGITGSGKTEVYLAITNAMLVRGLQVLLLVPEISLTPQLLERFSSRIAEPMVVLHSGLSDTERAFAWQQACDGDVRVVIGTRSAVFTPMPALGVIIVDEEHDLSFKQQEGFRYSARDMAVALGKRVDCPVLLGSATPSFESLQNVARGNYQLAKLTQRAGGAVLPSIDLIDIRSVRLDAGFSPVTRRFIAEELDKSHQVLVFINRRGFAPVLTCHDCGWVAQCHRCDARMTIHAGRKRLICHHCGHQQFVPNNCPDCGGESMTTLGQGTEQIETVLNRYFPQASCVRIDYDSTRRKGSMHEKLNSVREGKHQILVGTQMLAKGHDFPNVTLVVMLDIDQGLYGSDFRASERMAQQIMQVSGRAGRADKPGRVLIQTHHPDHPLLHLLIQQGYEAFAKQALLEREQAQFPPFSYQVLIRAEATRESLPEDFLNDAVRQAGKPNEKGIEFWGPVAAAMQRKKGQHRFHLLIQSASRLRLHEFLDAWLPELEKLPSAKKVRWSVDVDPQDFYS